MRADERSWPTARQRELIIAATAPGERAAEAWQRWLRGGDLLDIDQPSYRLLPLLWRNRTAAGIAAEHLALLRGCYRQSLWSVHRTLAAGMTAVDSLDAAGVPVMLLKGAAILASNPPHIGIRPMADVDLLVPRPDAARAVRALQAGGWDSVHGLLAPIGVWHAVDLVRAEHERVDLHWSATSVPGDDRAVWADARRATLLERSVLVPSPTFQLLTTCVHGVGFDPAPVRWIADALLILGGRDQIDWPALLEEAVTRHVAVALGQALRELAGRFDAPVPDRVVRALSRRLAPGERAAQRAAGGSGRGADYVVELQRYRRLRAIGDPDRAGSFVGHCARRWGFDSAASLARAVPPRLAQLARHGRAEPWPEFARRARAGRVA
ncbi:MAG TPA: nucleotidyltransferase family protein [Solirubrobacteraceae bacterium]|nr:nucleotidyltransferase family protein [Solirubrobacteraceae bacterium]